MNYRKRIVKDCGGTERGIGFVRVLDRARCEDRTVVDGDGVGFEIHHNRKAKNGRTFGSETFFTSNLRGAFLAMCFLYPGLL